MPITSLLRAAVAVAGLMASGCAPLTAVPGETVELLFWARPGAERDARSQNARFSLAHRLAATFPGAGNASRKPETTVTEATTAGRGDNCGVVHNVRGRVGPRGLNRPPCSTKSSSADCEWRIVVAVLISIRPQSGQPS